MRTTTLSKGRRGAALCRHWVTETGGFVGAAGELENGVGGREAGAAAARPRLWHDDVLYGEAGTAAARPRLWHDDVLYGEAGTAAARPRLWHDDVLYGEAGTAAARPRLWHDDEQYWTLQQAWRRRIVQLVNNPLDVLWTR